MPIQTDLSVSPHFDDFSTVKDFYKILFRPGVSVQVRELNQLQSILQNQISSFGDNIFKQGTIIDGCDITYHDDLKYVKLRDVSTNSELIDVANFVGFRVKNQNDLVPLEASIIAADRGFEATDPDLNTIYLRYINSGFKTGGPAEGISQFEPLEQLTIYNPNQVVERVSLTEEGKSQGFSPNDRVVFSSALQVQNTSGGIAFVEPLEIGQTISDGTARAEIIGISDTVVPGSLVLSIKPLAEDLKDGDSSKWTFTTETNIQTEEGGPLSIARVLSILGTGASGKITTSTLGRVEQIQITNKGSGYLIPPTVSISSPANQINNIQLLDATAETFVANVVVAPFATLPVGSSYAVTVGEGIIYNKGYFSRVAEQLLIVEKYNNEPDGVTIGFETDEEIINSNQDPSLLDNSTGSPNETAPGANRLKLTPKLIRLLSVEADLRDDFLYVARFSDGKPYQQNRQTVYNVIGNEISRRISEESGDYVLDEFLLQTKSPSSLTEEANTFGIVIDPGKAYINGFRVETNSNYVTNVDKGTDIASVSDANISLNFGNFVRVDNFAGVMDFKAGDIVELYKTQVSYYETVGAGAPISKAGLSLTAPNLAGYARIRSVVFDSGIPGTKEATYRVYLFDLNLNPGVKIEDCASIFYDGPLKAVCDIKERRMEDVVNTSLIFYAGAPAVQNVSNISYIYRTNSPASFNTSGNLSITLAAGGTETFPYTGQLSAIQERDFIIIPQAQIESASNLTGTISVTNGSNTATIAGSTSFAAELRSGDFIRVGTNSQRLQITAVNQNGTVAFAEPATFTANTTFKLVFPANVPISFEYRNERTITVDPTQKQVSISLGMNTSTSENATVFYNVREANANPVSKVVNRNKFVRLIPGSNQNRNTGPWCLGVADAIRLNSVHLGPNSAFNIGDVDTSDITQFFYIDNNQNENYVDQAYLYLKPNSPVVIPNNLEVSLLVSFDYFSTSEEGLKAPGGSGTYNINDTIPLQDAVSSIHTLEIPEGFGNRGTYFDLRDQFDFRPSVASTVTPSSSPTTAPVNPLELTFSNKFSSSNKKFPAPDSELFATINYYQPRVDLVTIDAGSNFRIIKGTPGKNEAPTAPENALVIQQLKIPAYPSVPFLLSAETLRYADTKISSGKFITKRLDNYRVTTTLSRDDVANVQPKRYTMKEIGKLERRIEQLEYYTSLNLVETIAQKRFIPGFDGLNRFKFGFFVDGFEDYTYADTSDPKYSASIVDGYLSPALSELNLKLRPATGDESILPFNEVSFVSQSKATDGAVTPEIVVPTVTQRIVSVVQSERSRNQSIRGNVFEDFFYTMSATSGPVEFYLNARDNWMGLEVFQSNSPEGPWVSTVTSRTALPITSNDVVTKRLNLNGGRKIEQLGQLNRKTTPVGTSWGTWLEDQFKVLWTHNPERGIYYRLRIYKGPNRGGQGKSGTFGFKLYYPVDSEVNTSITAATTNFPLTYYGTALFGGSGASSIFASLTHIH